MVRRWRRVHTSPNVRKCPQMTGNGAKLRHKQEAAIVALLSHRSIEEAARAVPTSAKTLLRWLKELPSPFESSYAPFAGRRTWRTRHAAATLERTDSSWK